MSHSPKLADTPDLAKAAEAFLLEVSQAIAEHQGATAESAKEITRAWMRLAQEGLHRTMAILDELLRSESLPSVAEIQSRILRENMDALVKDSFRLAELASKAAQEASTRLGVERSYLSKLAHRGEPPDYAADNE
jgi:hypothetical protein